MRIQLKEPVKIIVRQAMPELSRTHDSLDVASLQTDLVKKLVKVTFKGVLKPLVIFDADTFPADGNISTEVIEKRVQELLEGKSF